MTRTAAIVCGAGVSSTFLARAVRTLAIVLVGHHLADRFEALQSALALSGVPAALLPVGDPVATAEQGVALLHSLDSARSVSEGHPHG